MATATEPTQSVKTKGRILIVDDELVVRDSLGKWFTSEGYTTKPVGQARAKRLETIQQSNSISRCSISRCRAWTAWSCRRGCARPIRT